MSDRVKGYIKVLCLGGTSDGLSIAKLLNINDIEFYFSVATDYGYKNYEKSIKHIIKTRFTADTMKEFIDKNGIKLVIDATHPFATEISKTAILVARQADVKYIRYERTITEIESDNIKSFDNFVDAFKLASGKVLMTGTKNVSRALEYIKKDDLIIRMIPDDRMIDQMLSLGLRHDNLICEKGPFSVEQNIDHINKYDIKYMIFKQSGRGSGYEEKVEAIDSSGITGLLIKPTHFEYEIKTSEYEDVIKFVKEWI